MEDYDPFLEAVVLNTILICDGCRKAARDEYGPTPVSPTYPDDGWDIALANAAKSEGWTVIEQRTGFLVLCPKCSSLEPG